MMIGSKARWFCGLGLEFWWLILDFFESFSDGSGSFACGVWTWLASGLPALVPIR